MLLLVLNNLLIFLFSCFIFRNFLTLGYLRKNPPIGVWLWTCGKLVFLLSHGRFSTTESTELTESCSAATYIRTGGEAKTDL